MFKLQLKPIASIIPVMDNIKKPHSRPSYEELEKQLEEIQKELILEKRISFEGEKRFESLFKNAPLPYHSLNQDGYIIEVNPAWLSTMGYSLEEIIGKYYGDFLHPDLKEHFKNKFPQFKKAGNVQTTFKIRHKKGHYLDIDISGNIIYNINGSFKQTNCVFHDITENKRIEDALLKNQYNLSKAQEIGKIGTWEIDIKNNKRYWTKENYKIFGVKQGTKLTHEVFLDCIHPEDKDYVDIEWETALKGKPYDIEHRIVVDGETRWVQEKADIKFDENGEAISVIGFSQDITQKKKRENELVLKNIVFDSSISANSIADVNGILTNVNKAFLNFWGYESSDEVIGKFITEFIKFEYDVAKITNALNEEGQWTGEYIGLKKDGTEFIAHANASTLKDINNNFIGYQSTVVDVTDRKHSEKKIKLNEQRLNSLVELNQMTDKSVDDIHDFTLTKAIELTQSGMGFLGFVNNDETEVSIYKWSTSAMKQCSVKDIPMNFNVEDSGIWGDVIRKRSSVMINDYSEPNPRKKGLPSGHVTIKNYLSIPVFDDNKVVSILAVANKPYNYSQTDIKQLTLLLEGMWRFLMQIKEKEELQKAKEKAEESDRLKSAFLTNMSHEIRTPMNGILGFTELLRDADLSVENQHGYIEIIKKSGDRLLNTVNDIIEISRIESGEVKQSVDEVNFINHLENLVAFFTPEIKEKGLGISIDNEISDLDSIIQTDKTKLSSILSNLIKNAIKYTNEGFIKVGFKLNEGQLIFYCKDSGIGIPKNRQEAIFNRFEQADIEDKQVHEGSGLGLAIVKSYVEMLGGKIWVESEDGKGSAFYVALTYSPFTSQQNDLSINGKSSEIEKKKINVLIVEDDELSSLHLSVLLDEFVQNIRSVQDGIEAIDTCKNDSSIDLILMDMKMPKINGFEATRRIREFNKDVVIIAQTACIFNEDKQKALASGCNDFISKPIKKDELIGLVNKYF